jgi:hypothetical protein
VHFHTSFVSLAVVVLCVAAGCAIPPEPAKDQRITRERVERFIVKGKTTKEQVIAEFGLPTNTTIMSKRSFLRRLVRMLPGSARNWIAVNQIATMANSTSN